MSTDFQSACALLDSEAFPVSERDRVAGQPVTMDATGSLPAYTAFMTLEELGLLYMFERATGLTLDSAVRMALVRGAPEVVAREIADFHFARAAQRRASSEVPASSCRPCEPQGDLAVTSEISATAPAAEAAPERETPPVTAPAPVDAPGASAPPQRKKGARKTLDELLCLGEDAEEVLTMPIKGGKRISVRRDCVEQYQKVYRDLDVAHEFQRASVWLESNEKMQKTPRGMRRFLNGWLSRQLERRAVTHAVMSAQSQNGSGFGSGGGAPESLPAAGEDDAGAHDAFTFG